MVKRMSLISIVPVILMLACISVWADTVVTFQRGVNGSCDDNPIGNYFYNWGGAPEMSCAQDIPNGREVRTLIRFNTSSIPTGSTIISAKLSLQQFYFDGPGDISAYEVYKPWTEYGSDWWGYQPAQLWQVFGCDGPTDRSFNPLDTVSCTQGNIRYEWNITSAVQDWVSNLLANNGVILTLPVPPFGVNVDAFRSSEYSYIPDRPSLTVDYVVPEPATMILLGLGLGFIAKGRKR